MFEKSLSEKKEMAERATKELREIASTTVVDGNNIDSVLDRIGFKWCYRTEYETIVVCDQDYNIRFFMSSDYSTISYELTDDDAWELVLERPDFDYLSINSEDTCIYQTDNCIEFVDDDGYQRSMRAQVIISNEDLEKYEDLSYLDLSDSYPVID